MKRKIMHPNFNKNNFLFHFVQQEVNDALPIWYWIIDLYSQCTVLENKNMAYEQKNIDEPILNYRKNLGRVILFGMRRFYREFSGNQITIIQSRQLLWSHFVVLLPIEYESKLYFYIGICCDENWNFCNLCEYRGLIRFKCVVVSNKNEEPIENVATALQSENKMFHDLFYCVLYIFDFLILKICPDFVCFMRQKYFIFDGKS